MLRLDALLNDFAIRSFRDIADGDYIAARTAYRTQLLPQALWASQQAIEKYVKCILLLNRIKASDVRHDLSRGLQLIDTSGKFSLRLSRATREFVDYLDTFGRFRYFETPYHVFGNEILLLDKAVWEIRRYCTVLDYNRSSDNKPMLPFELRRIEESENYPPQHYVTALGGLLEKIIEDKKHPARHALIWQNPFFGKRIRKKVRFPIVFHSANSPLSLNPELLAEVTKYVYIPQEVRKAYTIVSAKERSRS